MDPGIQLTVPNPIRKTNFLSKVLFIWMIKFFRKCKNEGLKVTELYKTLKDDRSDLLGSRLEANWLSEITRSKDTNKEPNLYKAIFNTFIGIYMYYGVIQFIQLVVFRSMQPIVLGYLLRLFTKEEENADDLQLKKYIAGAVMIAISFVYVFLFHHSNLGLARIGMRLRVAVGSLIYRKLMKLNKKSLGQTASGQVVNILSNDVARFDYVSIALHFIWMAPFQLAIVTYLIWDQVGIASLSGILSVILFTVPVQGYLGKIVSKVRNKIALWTDQRVRLMNEIVMGIQVIKMYAWEKPFELVVKNLRKNELKHLKHAAYIRGVLLSCMVVIERGTLYLTTITYALMGEVITSDKVFSLSQLFNLLQLALAIYLPLAISIGAEAMVTMARIKSVLLMDEIEEANITINKEDDIIIEDVSARWNKDFDHLTLNNINVRIPKGKLCAIVGPVGSGKSSFLNLLLGELQSKCGHISLCGSISYASQEPWLFVSSVRNNILFGQAYEKKLYQHVSKVCALLPDFIQLPQRDKSLVGERGVALSGGQRARINLARAVYRDADIYLLDDPLSAVDTHVGKHLFDQCILGYLESKTRILVTHQLQYLKKADFIIVINEGKIEAQGSFDEISKSDNEYAKMLVAADETVETEKTVETRKLSRKISTNSAKSIIEEDDVEVAEEEMGKFEESVFKTYIKSFGNRCFVALTFVMIILAQVSCSGADYFISYWTTQEELIHANDIKSTNEITIVDRIISYIDAKPLPNQSYYQYNVNNNPHELHVHLYSADDAPMDTHVSIYIYTGIIIAIVFFTMARSFAFFKVTINASKRIHYMMFNSLLTAPMRFFDMNPSGRILNRFSKDMGAVDEVLPRVTIDTIQIGLVMCGILAMVIVTNYWMTLAIVVFMIVFMFIRTWYLSTLRTLKHVEGIAKSPVFSHINSSLNGIATIRVAQLQRELISEFDHHQDVHTSSWYLTLYATESFGLWIDIVCVLFTATITFTFIALSEIGSVNSSSVGLAISQSLILTGMVPFGARQAGEVVNQFTSVERILHYTTLDREGPFEADSDKKLPKTWPNKGQIKFKNMFLRYTALEPPVLKDLNIEISPGEKIGIVGRTGAGKSSMINALFRLSMIEGSIRIDDVETLDIGLTMLRRKISIIPQEPVLFSATLRYNLDPFGEYTDDSLWSALEEVELKEAISNLDFMVDEGGSNFSVGQRQLVCLARAILRNNPILVLDEATANVDPQTDNLIQKTIRRKFKNCTVLTIAHRLNTIMDSDKVIVMDAGRMIQYDHPYNLMQDESSHFNKMVAQTGPTMSNTLYEVAKHAYETKVGNESIKTDDDTNDDTTKL